MVDEHGYISIKGCLNDDINVFGYRLSTVEIKSALIVHKGIAESAVMGATDELTGQAVFAFAALKPEFAYDPNVEASLTLGARARLHSINSRNFVQL
ncbi:hypothetical protein M405DRAFT_806954 [Rhizopogon salebrosus TDB-379]|nr:hypothetical protein M405DRAFT_806954 [Rhizopogon salebrosus TDB-379]